MNMPISREANVTEMTAHLQAEVDSYIRGAFPLIDASNPEADALLVRYNPDTTPPYLNTSIVHASFYPDGLNDKTDSHARQVLQIALGRAADDKDPAYARHAAEHMTFPEAIEALITASEAGEALGVSSVPCIVTVTDDESRKGIFKANRFVIETELFPRRVFRPEPYVYSLNNARKTPQNSIPGFLRKTARQSETGTAQAVLTAMYLGLTPIDIMNALDEKNLKKELLSKTWPYVTRSRGSDWKLLNAIREALMVESDRQFFVRRSSDAYHQAMQLLESGRLLPSDAHKTPGFGYAEIDDMVTARSVWVGVAEIAQKNANLDFADPARTLYIDRRFSGYSTTSLATAYIPQEI
ncbi:hypothetical protein KKG44_02090 [Patescibacteria group bacterium]|nr:hypothetical protein [Patescibacteria group bacterium]